jgi:glycosidase
MLRLQELIQRYRDEIPVPPRVGLNQRDAILITYGDQVRAPGRLPLKSLTDFSDEFLAGLVSGIHVLPFFPYSSDDGFAVIDYRQVNPNLGDWGDIRRLGRNFRLMFDAVINHISGQSEWFQGYLHGDPRYQEYFITLNGDPDLSKVVRPRSLPLLTTVTTSLGERKVWTTFSDDQIDLNYKNPQVMLDILDLLLFYASQGAEFLRLDAIAYLWKEIGTSCIHLPQTHRIVQLFRDVFDLAAPHLEMITETNVPHEENLSYFGDGTNEAQMVYNFALPPLVMHAVHTGRAQTLSRWASGLELPSDQTTFFNFLASHDGIGLNPARGILLESEIQALIERARAHGGLVSYKRNPDGSESPYELNINYFDALSDPRADEPLEVQVDRFLLAHAVMLALIGVPGIYFHSLFGSRSWPQGVAQTGRKRSINRQKLALEELQVELIDPNSLRGRVYRRMAHLLEVRASQAAFDPTGEQRVVQANPALFCLLRLSPAGDSRLLCLHNFSPHRQLARIDLSAFTDQPAVDLIGGNQVNAGSQDLELQPYQAVWLKLGP